MVNPTQLRSVPARTFGYVADTGDNPPSLPSNSSYRLSNGAMTGSVEDEMSPFNVDAQNQHSLPTIEMVKTEAAIRHGISNDDSSAISSSVSRFKDFEQTTYNYKSNKTRFCRRPITLIFFATLVLGLIIGLSAYLAGLPKQKASGLTDNESGTSTVDSNAFINDSDRDGITNANDADYVPSPDESETRRKFIVQLLSARISHMNSLTTPGTPQYQAVEWLVSQDNFYDIPTDPADYTNSFHYIQRYIMAVFYYALDGPNWQYPCKFLSTDKSVCDWQFNFKKTGISYGVKCNSNDEITDILMSGNNLKGSLPAEIGDLLALQHLSLYGNSLTGSLPSRMEVLSDLWFLQLETNQLSGTIPAWIGALSALEYLGLGDNQFSGKIPNTLFGLTSIKEIDLSYNKLTGGIDVFDGDMCPQNLKLVYIIDNDISGRIHEASFSNCSSMQEVDLSKNQLTGYFPAHFYQYDIVNLAENQLQGRLPAVPDFDKPLWFLSLAQNQLSGSIPTTINQLDSLTHLDLSENFLNGLIPDVFGGMIQLRSLYLSNNAFEKGNIPYLADVVDLTDLSMAGTNRVGLIPSWLGSLRNLTLLDLHNNSLYGEVPSQLGELGDTLSYLLLNQNQLNGIVPATFNKLNYSETLYLNNNNFSGSINFICDANIDADFGYITADCDLNSPKVSCSCCSTCCASDDTTCNVERTLQKVNMGYPKDHYLYTENIVLRTADGN